jgi:hypothetical protein
VPGLLVLSPAKTVCVRLELGESTCYGAHSEFREFCSDFIDAFPGSVVETLFSRDTGKGASREQQVNFVTCI